MVLHVAKIHGDVGIDLLYVENVPTPLQHAHEPGPKANRQGRRTGNQHVDLADEQTHERAHDVEPDPAQQTQRRPDALVRHRHMVHPHAVVVALLDKRPERPAQGLFRLKARIAVEVRRGGHHLHAAAPLLQVLGETCHDLRRTHVVRREDQAQYDNILHFFSWPIFLSTRQRYQSPCQKFQ